MNWEKRKGIPWFPRERPVRLRPCRGLLGGPYMFLRNEPTVLADDFLCITSIVSYLCRLQGRFAGGFVLENEPTGRVFLGRFDRKVGSVAANDSGVSSNSAWKTNPPEVCFWGVSVRNAHAHSHYPTGLETTRGGLAPSQGARLSSKSGFVVERRTQKCGGTVGLVEGEVVMNCELEL